MVIATHGREFTGDADLEDQRQQWRTRRSSVVNTRLLSLYGLDHIFVRTPQEGVMATARKKASRSALPPSGRRALTEGKVRKEFWLDPAALAEAQAFLGTETERETVEMALDLVAFRRDLIAGARALKGMRLSRLG